MEATEKMLKIIIATHYNPTLVIQNLYDKADIWEKAKIKAAALRLGIKLDEEEK